MTDPATQYTGTVEPFSLARAIDRHLIPWTQMDWPLDLALVFGRSAPVRLELGFGNGAFIETAARESPHVNWLGVELSWGSTRRLLKRVDAERLGNVRVIQADGALVLERLFGTDSLDQVIINNSDPWPKPRHHRRRLIQPGFVEVLASRLRSRGRAVVVTDHADYADWIQEILENQSHLRSVFETGRVAELPGHHSTKYRERGIEAGSEIHYFVWEKIRSPEGAECPSREVEEMPNVLLRGTCDFRGLFAGFEPQNMNARYRDEPVLIQLIAPYLNADGTSWLVETRVSESGFVQHLALTVAQKSDGTLLVKPAPLGNPRPTWGLKQAVSQLVHWVTHKHPELEILSSSVGKPLETINFE